ncbi:tripartite tricarboxylate transporter substrate-binding protein [Nisaea acidiphila]|uniref:Tripartite tricarboxylate transporter substrate-binding protein n=1 Tax=Nisaea acidiphila TaxID=1862145 RepID=A0A9J7AST1_9PROT|nr:tripartite tricarboxylate transporter substrate-binding protein [Nisaea acidiphila]UUX50343.1 tripartite tricarboxylate transporter substrate-binding protein [Nisaea acidiphila]
MKISRRSLMGLAVCAGLAMGAVPAAQAFEPVKPIDFIIMAGKGGGADKMARLMQTIVEKHNMASKPLIPINKPGGSGAEALVHVQNAKDQDHTIMVTLNSFYTTPMRQPGLGVDSLKFAPIARMAEDTFLLWVHKDSGLTSFDQWVDHVKKVGDKWVMGGTGKLQEDQLITDFLNANFDLKIKYVPYKGGGTVAKQVAGKHVNSSVNNPSEIEGFYKAGTAIPLVSFTKERLDAFPNAPTMKEKGHDFAYYMQRSVVGAPGMSQEAQDYYTALFKKVYESAEWQDYRTKKSLYGEFLTGDDLRDYWKVNNETHRAMLAKMGAS